MLNKQNKKKTGPKPFQLDSFVKSYDEEHKYEQCAVCTRIQPQPQVHSQDKERLNFKTVLMKALTFPSVLTAFKNQRP